MDYKKHTQQRFIERFIPIIKRKKTGGSIIDWLELTDDDYSNLCRISLENPLFIHTEKRRVIVKYRNTFMWCCLSKKGKIVKTIYPIDTSDFRKYLDNNG